MRILFLADVFGSAGRPRVEERLPGLREELGVDVLRRQRRERGRRARDLTPKLADKLLAAGADVVTLGNHVWARDEIGPYLAQSERVIRPGERRLRLARAGRSRSRPATDGTPVAVINLLGSLFLDVASGPFEVRRRARRGGPAAERRS